MADPTFRSLSQIIGEMVSTFLSELNTKGIAPGIQSLKPGSPYLAVFEAVAQSQFRNQEQTLSLLDANDLDIAHDERLDRIGLSENLPRRGATFALGYVTLLDTSFTKKSSRIYQGKPAPIAGATVLYVGDATGWPLTGSVYVGRGTANLEGPFAYSSVVNVAPYWQVNLSAPLAKFHGYGETVTVAQGGDRTVAAGQVVSTPIGGPSATSVSYSTTQGATILDGETSVTNVPVTCQAPGAQGNTSAASINTVTTPAFTGMSVTNPLPLSNGLDIETDDLYRARIKSIRQSRQRGTKTAIETFAYGVTAPDESSTCIAAQVVQRTQLPTLLVIDDGTGYEEKTSGIASEVLVQSAVGGETTFYLRHGRPVAKAAVTTTLSAPFALWDGAVLSVVVRQVQYDHTITADNFRNVAAASAYEVVNSINADSALPFKAHTVGNGLQVAIFVETDDNDDIQVLTGGANTALQFPIAKVQTLRLYKNDRLLSKDGLEATVYTSSQGTWGSVVAGDTLIVAVDGTAAQTYRFYDADFVALGTGLTAVSSGNSLASWAAVFNNKVPGITASVRGANLQLVSNKGRSSSAAISIDPTSILVQKGVFGVSQLSAAGSSKDYTLNKNLGEVELLTPLLPGESLVAGSPYTRGYLESGAFASIVTASPARFWFVIDGADVIVSHSMTGSNRVRMSWTKSTFGGGDTPVRRFAAYVGAPTAVAAYPFQNVKVGDWVIFTEDITTVTWSSGTTYPIGAVVMYGDAAYTSLANGNFNNAPLPDPGVSAWWTPLAPSNLGAFRVSNIDPAGQWFETEELETSVLTGSYDYSSSLFSKLYFARSDAAVQQVTVPAATYTPTLLAASLSSGLVGAFSTATTASKVQVTTDTYALEGKVSLVALDTVARSLLLVPGSSLNNDTHIAAIESDNSSVGTPHTTATSGNILTWNGTLSQITGTNVADLDALSSGWMHALYWARSKATAAHPSRFGTNVGRISNLIQDFTYGGTTFTIDNVLHDPFSAAGDPNSPDRTMTVGRYRLGPESTLNLVLDRNPLSKGFAIPMFRRVIADAGYGPYGTTIRLKDLDNSSASLALAFGTTFDFGDFVLHGHSRAVTHPSTASKSVLWRVKDFNIRGPNLYVGYLAPIAAAQATRLWNVDPYGAIDIVLASGAARAVTITANSKWLFQRSGGATQTFASALAIANLTRAGSAVTATVTLPGDITTHNLTGSVWVQSASVDFPPGLKTITPTGAATFTYSEAGAAVSYTGVAGDYVDMDSGNFAADFTSVTVGDYISISDSFSVTAGLPTLVNGLTSQTMQVTAKGQYYVQGRKFTSGTTGWWTVQPAWFSLYPLASNTASAIVSAVNGLTGPSATLTGVLLGSGAGSITQDSQEDPTQASAVLHDGMLHISRLSNYTNVAGVNTYNIVLKVAPNSTLVAQNPDWANETFRLVPTTTKNVVDFLNAGNVTGLASTGASILAAHRADRVQISSGTLGSSSAVQVSGGTANALTVSVSARSVISGTIVAAVPYSADLLAIANRQMVAVNNSTILPKTLDWTSGTSVTVFGAGVVDLGVAGTAWAYSNSGVPVFGDRWYVEDVGNLTSYTLADRGLANASFALPNQGDWVTLEAGVGSWLDVTTKSTNRIGSICIVLNSGKVLYAGGTTRYSVVDGAQTVSAAAYIFDPATNVWAATTTPNMNVARAWARAVILPDNRVLVTGGISAASTWESSCEIYDPIAGSWTNVGNMSVPRSHHTLTLAGGVVIATGGTTTGNAATNTADSYSIAGSGWSGLPVMTSGARSNHFALLQGSTRLLVFGGNLAAIDSYSLIAGTWSTVGTMLTARRDASYVVRGSKLLVFGGSTANYVDPYGWTTANVMTSVESVDLVVFSSTYLAPMRVQRGLASLITLADGRYLVLGGITSAVLNTSATSTRSAEIYDPVSNTWSWAVGAMRPQGTYGSAVVLADGRVLAANCVLDTGLSSSDLTTEAFYVGNHASSTGNIGRYRVLLVDSNQNRFFVENHSSVAEEAGFGMVVFHTYDSAQVGDTFRVGGGALGNTSYDGSYVITALDLTDPTRFTVSGLGVLGPVTPGAAKLPYLSILPSAPSRMFFEVVGVYPNDASSTLYNIALSPSTHYELVSDQAGSVIEFLDRLRFPTGLAVGQDGYRYDTGLIGEVNKVVYGDPRDTTTYPGVAAAGAYIDVSAPLIKRVTVSVAIRAMPGVVDVKTRVQSAVAKVINGAPPAPIAISDIIEAVSGVYGVLSVVMIYPVPTATADSIPVQPGEKAMILDIDNDVQVSFIGA